MVRSPCRPEAVNLKKGPWTPEEDEKLVDYINKHGFRNWKTLPKLAGLNRCGKSCRLRWTNYLRPDIKRGGFSEEEERIITNLHSVLGNKWSQIAAHLPGRTDNEIKNFWNTHMRKKLLKMGIDPHTHQPRTDFSHLLDLSQFLGAARFGNLTSPLDNVLKLRADLQQLAKVQLFQNLLQILNTSPLPNVENTGSSGLQTPINPVGGPALGGASTSFIKEEPISKSQDLPREFNEFQAISNSWNGSTCCFETQTENPLPELVSATQSPETSSNANGNQIQSKANSISSPTSTMFEAWERLVDDETIGNYWNEILDLPSSPFLG